MSYCVNCGVELNPAAARCPLCGTPVCNPKQPVDETATPFFPTAPTRVEPVSRRELALILSAMLASVSVCCGLLNLVLKPQILWNLFVVGAAAMLWVWLVFPLLVRNVPLWGRLTLDVAAVGIYVYLISLALHGRDWFLGLAVPLLAVAMVVVFVLSWLLRRGHSLLTTTTLSLAAAGIFCLGVEVCCDRYCYGTWDPGWSLVVLACCLGLCVPLIVIRRVPSLREEVRRRLHF